MQTFMDLDTKSIFQFENDVVASQEDGAWVFKTAEGDLLKVSKRLVPSEPIVPDLLQSAITIKMIELNTKYIQAIQQSISYLSTQFQADLGSQDTLNKVLTGCNGVLPADFYWLDIANVKVTVTLAQLQTLSSRMVVQGWTAFQNLQDKKAAVKNAITVAEVNGVTWQ